MTINTTEYSLNLEPNVINFWSFKFRIQIKVEKSKVAIIKLVNKYRIPCLIFCWKKEHFAHIYSSKILKNILLLCLGNNKISFKVKFYKTSIPTNPFFNYLLLQDKKYDFSIISYCNFSTKIRLNKSYHTNIISEFVYRIHWTLPKITKF